jgi:hypothetical protein
MWIHIHYPKRQRHAELALEQDEARRTLRDQNQ